MSGIGAGTEDGGYARHFASLGDLFAWSLVFPYPPAAAPTVPLPAWFVLIIALAAIGFAWRKHTMPAGALAGGLVAILVAVWLTTASSAVVWRLLEPLLGKLQFPWRWQTIAGTGLAVLLAVGWQAVHRHAGDGKRSGSPTYSGNCHWRVPGSVCHSGVEYDTRLPAARRNLTVEGMWAFDSQNGQVGAPSWTGEFLPNEVTEQRWAMARASGRKLGGGTATRQDERPGADGRIYRGCLYGHLCAGGQSALPPILLSGVTCW